MSRYLAAVSGCRRVTRRVATPRQEPRRHVAGDELHDRVEATFVRMLIALDVDFEAA
jgi:hypothetical protein